jgi:hypothetical protein
LKFEGWARSRGLALWYFSISAGFLMLAVYFYLRDASAGTLALRLAISVAFAALGYMQLKMPPK